MWNRRKDEENPPKTAHTAVPPAPSQIKETQSTMSSTPTRNYDPPVQTSMQGHATIGKAVMIKGQIFSREDLIIDGEVEGTVEAQEHRVTIGPNGKVHAGLKAREIVVQGTIQGNVEATDKIDIRKDAKLIGDIKTARIVIEDGAFFKGSIDITRSEPKVVKVDKPAVAPASAPSAATPATSPVGAAVPAGVPGK